MQNIEIKKMENIQNTGIPKLNGTLGKNDIRSLPEGGKKPILGNPASSLSSIMDNAVIDLIVGNIKGAKSILQEASNKNLVADSSDLALVRQIRQTSQLASKAAEELDKQVMGAKSVMGGTPKLLEQISNLQKQSSELKEIASLLKNLLPAQKISQKAAEARPQAGYDHYGQYGYNDVSGEHNTYWG